LVFVFIGCTRLAGSDYPMDTKFLTLSPCSHHHPVQTFHEISDDKFISPEARMNINFVSQGLRRTAEPDSQAREQVEPKHMSRRPSTRSRHRD